MTKFNIFTIIGFCFMLLGVVICGLYQFGVPETPCLFIGGILLLFGIIWLICHAYLRRFKNIFTTVIVTSCITTVVFCVFAMFVPFPFIPSEYRESYMTVAIPFLAIGGGTTTIDTIILIIKK